MLKAEGWPIGAEDFSDWLADKLPRRGQRGVRASERTETDQALAERIVTQALAAGQWREIDLAMQPKGHPLKVSVATEVWAQTPMTRQWIADRLKMGSADYVSNPLKVSI